MRPVILSVLVLLLAGVVLGACAANTPTPEPQANAPITEPEVAPTTSPQSAMANPASQNCIKLGGTLDIRQRSDGAQYGVCTFEDNRQCEEWALLRGECPAGGVEVTGYVTMAAQYCAITGGQYAVTGNSNTDQEQGTCTLPGGQTCDARQYYEGSCPPTAGAEPSTTGDPFAYCAAVGTVDVPEAPYDGPAMPEVILQAMVRQGIVATDAPPDFQKNAVWRCMDGQVWACHFGANLPCQEKADSSQAPTAEMQDFCKANPAADTIPAAVTGRATVYEWKCTGGQPEIGKQLFAADPQGYLADFWYPLAAQ